MPDGLNEYDVELDFRLYVTSHKLPLWAIRRFTDLIVEEVETFNRETLTSDRIELDRIKTSCEPFEPEFDDEDAEEYKPYDEK